jgi:hypothetical protein
VNRPTTFYASSLGLVVYVGLSSTFIANAMLMLSQWLIILMIMSAWGTIVKRSIHYSTWFAVLGWFLALLIQQSVVVFIQHRIGGVSHYLMKHDLHQLLLGILLILPAIPVGYIISSLTKRVVLR